MKKSKDEKSEIKAKEKFILSITEMDMEKRLFTLIIVLLIVVEKEL